MSNDMLLVTTVGRSSGRSHTVPLLYLRDSEKLVVVASYGGRDRHPDWYLNLEEDPRVEVELPGSRMLMKARTAEPQEREIWWPRVVDAYQGYAAYQDRTLRQIPLVFLEPIDSEA